MTSILFALSFFIEKLSRHQVHENLKPDSRRENKLGSGSSPSLAGGLASPQLQLKRDSEAKEHSQVSPGILTLRNYRQ